MHLNGVNINLVVKLKALADANRLAILKLLLGKRYCVRALAGQLGVTEAAISQHLRVLKEAGFLTGQKRGYFMHYEVERDALTALAEEVQALLDTPIQKEPGKCIQKPHCQCNSGKLNDGVCCREKKRKGRITGEE